MKGISTTVHILQRTSVPTMKTCLLFAMVCMSHMQVKDVS